MDVTEENKYFTILYGSQTGTAEDLSKRISWEAKRRHLSVKISSMDSYPFQNLIEERCILFVCSTMGQGEEPDNMKAFWKLLLRKSLPANSLVSLHFGVIALGDSSYSKYNFVGKRLFKRLQQLSAVPIMEIALGDDQHELGPDAAIDPWLEKFWLKLEPLFPVEYANTPLSKDVLLPPIYSVEIQNQIEVDECNEISLDPTLIKTKVISNERETSQDHFQDVRLLKIDINNTNLKYECGDVAIIQPVNLEDNVEEFFKLVKVNPENVVKLSPNHKDTQLPSCLEKPHTIREIVRKYFDIQSVPKRSFFEIFRHFSKSELEKEKLEEFCTAQGQDELYTYCNRPRRSILETLNDFPDTTPHVPFEYFFDLIPPIRARHFTIASSPLAYPNEIHILVAVVKYFTRLRKPRLGLCSTYMSNLKPGELIDIGVKKGTFIWPPREVPAILIGPGTGCAPFRAYAQERCHKGLSSTYIFLGFRNKEGDYLCKDEWISFEKDAAVAGKISVFTTFSRDQEDKIYVQHKILEQANLIWKLLRDEKAWIFIAGNAKQMPQDVQKAFCEIFTLNGMDEKEAELYLKQLDKEKRLQLEVWA